MKKIRLLPFGGRLLKKSNAKTARVLCATSWTRVTLEARSCRFDLPARREQTRRLVKAVAKKARVQVEDVLVEKTHLHFNVRLRRKSRFAPFIRSLTGTLALKFSGSSKKNPLKQSFWLCRPWTCVIKKLKALFGPSSEQRFHLDFELAELFRARHSEGLLFLGP